MKTKILLRLCLFTCLTTMLFSCSSSRYARYEKKSPGYSLNKQLNDKKAPRNIFNGAGKIEDVKVPATSAVIDVPASVPLPVENAVAVENEVKITTPAEATGTKEISPVISRQQNVLQKDQKSAVKNTWLMKKIAKSLYKKAIKEANKEAGVKRTDVDLLALIFAILIPPVGVILHEDGITSHFWIDLILTILLYLPGMIYAVLIVFDEIG